MLQVNFIYLCLIPVPGFILVVDMILCKSIHKAIYVHRNFVARQAYGLTCEAIDLVLSLHNRRISHHNLSVLEPELTVTICYRLFLSLH